MATMNAKQLKTALLSDIDALIEITAKDVSNGFKYTLASFIEVQEPLTTKKRVEITENYLRLHECSHENFSFEYGDAKYEFSPIMAPTIRQQVIHFPEGKFPTSNGTGTGRDMRAKQMQKQVAVFREMYQGGEWSKPEENEMRKNRVISQYKKAADDDLIRLCWKYITNPAEVEGVNVAWKEEPKAIFETYKETVKN